MECVNIIAESFRPTETDINDIIYTIDTVYDPKTKKFLNNKNMDMEIVTYEEPIIVINTLHSCYSHAIIDSCFPIFFAIQDLIKYGYLSSSNVRIFVRENDIHTFPKQNLPLIDNINHTYRGVWGDIISLITKHPIIFEHLVTKPVWSPSVFYYPINDNWQRSIWNSSEYYSSRNILLDNVRFKDGHIYCYLELFRQKVLQQCNVHSASYNINNNNLIIVERKFDRKFHPIILQELDKHARKQNGWNYKGVVILEDMTFTEQVDLFFNTKIVVLRHGSSLTNLLWMNKNCIVIELSSPNHPTKKETIGRICNFTKSKHIEFIYEENELFLHSIIPQMFASITENLH